MNEINFYSELKPSNNSIKNIFLEQPFSDVPGDWFVIIADVKNSTAAVSEGKSNDVNLVAAGALIAAINIARTHKIEIPFFFGGDGGTVLVPEQILNDVLGALAIHQQNCMKHFGLAMHIGSMSISNIHKAGHTIKITKLQIDNYFSKPVIIGDGLRYAEEQIKHSLREDDKMNRADTELNLTGLECRWDKIKPPKEETRIACYLIETQRPDKQAAIYYDVLSKIEEIFGDQVQRHPISPERLRLILSFEKLKKEMFVKFGKWKPVYFISNLLYAIIGRFYFRFNWKLNHLRAHDYLEQLIAHTDTLTVDGRINTIISGRDDQHQQFIQYLSNQEQEGHLVYGQHASKESIITCYIESLESRHMHFIDGSDGGYTEASKGFKYKWQQLRQLL